MNPSFKHDTIQGLNCIAGRNHTEHMRQYMKTGKKVCDNCIIHYNKSKKETCAHLVFKYSLELLKDLGIENADLTSAIECQACTRHQQPSYMYPSYKETECSVCKFGPYNYGQNCSKDIANAVLDLIEE